MISLVDIYDNIIFESNRLYDYTVLINKWIQLFNNPEKDPFVNKSEINKIKDVYSSLNTLNKILAAKEYVKLINKSDDNSKIKRDVEDWNINKDTIKNFDGIVYTKI